MLQPSESNKFKVNHRLNNIQRCFPVSLNQERNEKIAFHSFCRDTYISTISVGFRVVFKTAVTLTS